MAGRALETATFLLLLSLSLWVSPGLAQEDTCVACHSALEPRLSNPVTMMRDGIHASRGFGCTACHGGDAREFSMAAMDPAKGYIGVPERQEVQRVCGRCHSNAQFMKRFNPSIRVDQVAEYQTSVHGRRLAENDDPRVATCASCHTAHSIKPPSDPTSAVHPLNVAETCAVCHADAEYMESYNIPTDQYQAYTESVHWRKLAEEGDLSAPTCNDCHGNHGAAPPGISWVGNVCGQCHTVMGELFSRSFHSRVFTMLGDPGCATCHRNHGIEIANDDLLGVGDGTACGKCHGPNDNGGEVAMTMRSLIDSLHAEIDEAGAILSRAENAGMEVSEAQFQLTGANTALVNARTAVHSFSADSVRGAVEEGLAVTEETYARGEEALEDLRFRRLGLAVSVGIILVLIIGLVMKIRQLDESRMDAGNEHR